MGQIRSVFSGKCIFACYHRGRVDYVACCSSNERRKHCRHVLLLQGRCDFHDLVQKKRFSS